MEQIYEQPFYRVSCKALIYDETRTKVLLFKEENGIYEFPGGGLHFGETPQVNIRREIMEECGLEITRVDSKPSYLVVGEKDDKVCRIAHVFYEAKVKNINFTTSDECQELGFFTKEEALKLPIYSTVKMFFEQMK